MQAVEDAAEDVGLITGSKEVNLMGACAGGLTIAALQGRLQAKRRPRKIGCATFMNLLLLDSQVESPDMLFADEQTLESAKRRSYQSGVLDGRDMARVFAWMRPNDLIWNYWVNNYLMGKEPPAFDILYWNNDNTRLPAALHGDLLDLFKHNPLTRAGAPGGLRHADRPVQGQPGQLQRGRHQRPHHALGHGIPLRPAAGRQPPLHPVQQRAYPEHPQPAGQPQGHLLRDTPS